MKIIVKGTPPEEAFWWIGKRFSCKNCGCVFELEKGDFVTNVHEFRYECPTCKSTLRLRKPTVPPTPDYESIFGEVFGKGGVFEEVFGKTKL